MTACTSLVWWNTPSIAILKYTLLYLRAQEPKKYSSVVCQYWDYVGSGQLHHRPTKNSRFGSLIDIPSIDLAGHLIRTEFLESNPTGASTR